jgi:signal transduction histidine kinase/CheY-like chemotaxis protein
MSNDKKLHSRLEGLFAGLGSLARGAQPGADASGPPAEGGLPVAAHVPLARHDPLASPAGWSWETGADGALTACSPEASAHLAIESGDMLGKPLASLVFPGDDAGQQALAAALKAQQPFVDLRLGLRRLDGSRLAVLLSGMPIRDDAGDFAGYRGVAHAIGAALPNLPSLPALPAAVAPAAQAEQAAGTAELAPTSRPASQTAEPEAAEPQPGPRDAAAPTAGPSAGALDAEPPSDAAQAPPEPDEAASLPAPQPEPAPAALRKPGTAPLPTLSRPAAEGRPGTAPLPPLPGPTRSAPVLPQAASWGYVAGPEGLSPIADFNRPEMDEALTGGSLVARSAEVAAGSAPDGARRALALPIRLHSQTIGVLDFFDEGEARTWSDDDLALAQAVADQLALALENARLFAETREYLEKQTLLYEVTRAAASASDMNEALNSAAEALARVLPEADIAILLLDEASRNLRIRAAVGYPADLGDRLLIPVGHGVTGWVAENNQPALIADVRADPRYVAGVPGMASEAAVPLALGERVIGVLNVESPRLGAFDEQDLQLLSTLAGTLSAIIVNSNLLEAISHERERLGVLYDVLQSLITRPDRRAILQTALNIAPRIGAQHAYMLLLGSREVEAEFHSTLPGLDELDARLAREFALTLTRHGLERWVLEQRRPAVVADTRADERWHTAAAHAQDEPARAVISVPLQTQRGTLTGVLAYTHTQPGALREEQLPLIESIAGQVAVALENDLLRQQQQTQNYSAQALARAAQAMTRTLDEAELHQIVAEQLLESFRPNAVALLHWDPATNTFRTLALRQGDAPAAEDAWPAPGESMPATRRADLLKVIHERQGHIRLVSEAPGDQARESMVLPLLYGGEVEGVVEVVHTGPARGLSSADMELFQSILTAAASALQSARLYELQRQTAERLAEVDRLKSQFLANMSHELRTPLNSIIGFSRVILKGIDGPLTDLQTQDLTSINNAGQHLLGLINDILDMARIEAGKMELVLDEMDLRDTLRSVLSTAVALVKDKNVELREDIDPHLPTVRADAMRVRQVLLNLLSNAAKFTDHGYITLRARPVEAVGLHSGRLEPFVEISVTDSGPGIAPEDMARLFEPFSQVDASATRKVGGTGLGLSICRQLIELHNGRIWVESEVGRGSTFLFILPAGPAEAGAEAEPGPAAHGQARIVLAVDDDPGIIGLYRRYLEPHGYQVIGVTRSTEAITRAAELRPAAILLDVMMPNRDGWQVLAELKRSEVTSSIPVIMCTLASEPERAYDLGAAGYLSKPIIESDLVEALKNVPARASLGRASVLVIESQAEDLEFVRRALRSGNSEAASAFRLIEARDSQAGLTAARLERPAAIILNLSQPGLDGFATLAALRNDPLTRDIPVVALAQSELGPEERNRLTRQVTALRRKGEFKEGDLVQDLKRAIAARV